MALNIRLVTSNLVLKIVSLLLGFALWYIISQAFNSSVWLTVPVCIDNSPAEFTLTAADQIRVCIGGTRADIRALDIATLSLHIDGTQLHAGDNATLITTEKLFLPPSIKLLNYDPLVLNINATRTISKDTTACTA